MTRRRAAAASAAADSAAATTSSMTNKSGKERRSKRARSAAADDTTAHAAVENSLTAAQREERKDEQSAEETAASMEEEEKQDSAAADSGKDDAKKEAAEQQAEAVQAAASAGSAKQKKRKRAKAEAVPTKTKRKKRVSGAAAADEAKEAEAEAEAATATGDAAESPAGATEADERADKEESKEEKAEAAEEKKEGAEGKTGDEGSSSKKKSKKKRKNSLVDVSTLPLDVSGVSFMLMGDVNRSVCEGLILQHGGSVGSRVLMKPQWGGLSGPGTQLWKRAEDAGKTFITQRDFERWMKRVQKAKDKAETKAHALDEHLTQLLLEATSLSQVLIDLVVAYAVEEHPMLPAVRAWLKLEQRASANSHASTLPAPATDEQIADVEARLQTRLPFVLRQLLRMHNGAALQGDGAGMRVWPSTAELAAPRAYEELFTVPLQWLSWQSALNTRRMPSGIHSVYFVPSSGLLVAAANSHMQQWFATLYVVSESMEQFVEQYVQTWRSNIDAGEEQPASEEEKEQSEAKFDVDTDADEKEQPAAEGQQQPSAGEEEKKESEATDGEAGNAAASGESEDDSRAKTETATDSAMSDIDSATASTVALSPDARYVAAYRPSALSVPCMKQQWPTLRDKSSCIWQQMRKTRGRGRRQHAVWKTQLLRP